MPTQSPLNYAHWLKTKGPNDYWYDTQVPDDYAVKSFEHFTAAAEAGHLACRYLTWHITNRCNLFCTHCGVSAGERVGREVSLKEFAAQIPALKKIGVEYITLTGGEPFVRKDLFEILAVLRLCRFKIGLVSNGLGLQHHAGKLAEHPPDSITISIDGLEKEHNLIRQSPRSYADTLEALRIARSCGIQIVSVNTCVHPGNLDDLPALREAIFSAGATHWVLRPITPSGRAGQHPEYVLQRDGVIRLLRFVKESLIQDYDVDVTDLGYLGAVDSLFSLYPYFAKAGWNHMYLLPDGSIQGYEEDYLPEEGNLLHDDIEEIWKTGFQSYRQPELPQKCLECKHFGRCRGGDLQWAEIKRRCHREWFPALEAALL